MEIAWRGPAPSELPEMGPEGARAGWNLAGAARITLRAPGQILEGPEHAPPYLGITYSAHRPVMPQFEPLLFG